MSPLKNSCVTNDFIGGLQVEKLHAATFLMDGVFGARD